MPLLIWLTSLAANDKATRFANLPIWVQHSREWVRVSNLLWQLAASVATTQLESWVYNDILVFLVL